MSSWKKSLRPVQIKSRDGGALGNNSNKKSSSRGASGVSGNSTESWLPEYYFGSPDRISRYRQYDYMDFDVDVNMALDKTTEFSTLLDETTGLPFVLDLESSITGADAEIISTMLRKWIRLNSLSSKIFDIFRSTLKYGDQIYIRDPETLELYWVDVANVSRTIVNEETKEVEYYCIRNLDFNLQSKVATQIADTLYSVMGNTPTMSPQANNTSSSYPNYSFTENTYNSVTGKTDDMREYPIPAKHVVHISMNNGTDTLWPFGRSVLDTVFKPFRQKELMEDAIIIYRVQRSPERYVFKIDTGDMNEKKSREYLNEVKKEMRQKRTPVIDNKNGSSVMDTIYNPISMTDDIFFGVGMDGRGSSVEVLPGGECLALDTEIRLLDGSRVTLQECINRYKQGEQLWTFSIDPATQVVVPAMVSWAGVTREDSEMIKLNFSDGTSVNVTTDHKFAIKGRGLVEAQHIREGDEFYHVDLESKEHNMYFNTQSGEWMKVSEMFDGFFEEYPLKLKYRELFRDTRIKKKQKRDKVTLVSTMELPNDMAGTLTIDGNEYYTDNHNFTLGNGVFTQNSTGSIDDLKFFSNRLMRSLRVPISYMSFLTEDGQTYTYNDGKTGVAYMEEFSFAEYCKRLQRQIIPVLDKEFKLFLKQNDINVDSSEFEIHFVNPQSFSEYRQIEVDTAQLGVFQSVADIPYMSNRYKMKRFLNMSEAEIKENERLWMEENKSKFNVKRREEEAELKDGGVMNPSETEIEDTEFDEDDMFNDGDEDEN